MSDNKISREVYLQYAKKIVSVLSEDAFYEQYKRRVDSGASNFKLIKKRLIQDISIDWIQTIEECLPNLDTIVRNPRKFIVQEEDIVDISLAKSISTESVKHLAQHTNMISKVDADGTVTPNRILNITKEESFEIYENRFIYTLLLKLKDFVTMRYDKIKKASATQDVLELDVESRFNLPSKKVTYRTEYFAQLSFDEVMQLDPDTLTKIERIAKIDRIITDFLSSSFAKSMRNSAPVRPPITRTNVILKEPNFKKALTLWQFVETYQVTGGFSTSDDVEDYDIAEDSVQQLKDMVTLNTMLFESLYEQHETDFGMEDKAFADVLRVGEMDFRADELDRDEYAQELDDKEENEESENLEEFKPQEEEAPTEEESAPEISQSEPEIEEREVEKPVEEEVEQPPKEEDEYDDTEPDTEEFDKNLFDVRKLYKRPEDDKLRQEELIRVKDAIDRCLTAYRKIKQEEIDERDREDRRRQRREDAERRAEAFRKQSEAVEAEYRSDTSLLFGYDPFGGKVKLSVKNAAEHAGQKQSIYYKRNEKLDLNDKDLEKIKLSIEQMERANRERAELNAREDAEQENQSSKPFIPKANVEIAESAKPEAKRRAANAKKKETDDSDLLPKPEKKVKIYGESDERKLGVGALPVGFMSATDFLSGSYFGGDKVGIIVDKRSEQYDRNVEPKVRTAATDVVMKRRTKTEKSDPAEIITAQKEEKPAKSNKRASEKVVKKEEKLGAVLDVAKIGQTSEARTEKPKIRIAANDNPDIWAISATTANQKYSKPTGKARNISPVDEKKVAVGDIRLEKEDKINPYAELDEIRRTEKKQRAHQENDR